MEEELKPCPFCSSIPILRDLAGWEIHCKCGIEMVLPEPDKGPLIAVWNRRSAIAAPAQNVMAWACIVDGTWHGAFKHETDAKEAGFETGKRFDLLPLYAAPAQELAYPEGEVVGPCVCGSWPGGKCFKCPRVAAAAQEVVAYLSRDGKNSMTVRDFKDLINNPQWRWVISKYWTDAIPLGPISAAPASTAAPARPLTNDAIIDAAEALASLYDGDDRQDIKTDVMNSFYAGIKFAQSAAAPVVPEGFVLVPLEPTREMMQAAWDKANELWRTPEADDPLPGHQYRAMLAVAPKPDA